MRSRAVPAVGAVVLLALVVLAAGAGTPWRIRLPALDIDFGAAPTVSPPPAPTPPPLPPEDAGGGNTTWIAVVVVVVVAIVLLILGRSLVRYLVDRRPSGAEPTPAPDHLTAGEVTPGGLVDLPALADAVEAALRRLDEAATPHDAVVAAWVELEDAAARHGWERHASQTSTEFTAHLLGVSPAPREHTAALRGLYQQARFTTHPVTAAQVTDARAALVAIARAFEGRVP
ncbi:DUF4129 domain-containing protein [Xylanimonas ulmi]|uniref:DUF4129 domain-containing protein n=1 Tax=Xylanimonas ulmi TaxID=228973 RepID=UPI00102B6596|nr:DUF4129 domain-containing protein [Xylanibacterium ulmi]